MKNKLLIVGCGDIASRAAGLLEKHYQLFGLCRRAENSGHLRALGIRPITGDLDQPAKTQTGILPQRLIYISTSGVYGDCSGSRVSESHPTNPKNARAFRRLDAERQVRSWGIRNRIQVSILRVPGIYAHNRLPIERLQQRTPVLSSTEDSYTNHIHADDLARIIVAVLRSGRPGRIYHASDDSCLKMGEYFDLVADHFALSRPERITRQEARKVISPGLLSFMLESRRLTNDRIKRELRVRLRYPTVSDCLAEMRKIPVKSS